MEEGYQKMSDTPNVMIVYEASKENDPSLICKCFEIKEK